MKITTDFIVNLKTEEVKSKVAKARREGVKDIVTDIAGDAIKGSPVLTGNNRRSIAFEVGPNKPVAQKDGEGAVYSTSGYGGLIETGTVKMAARPYFKPALDLNLPKLSKNIKAHLQ